ncbi:MAG: hypothetical protein EXS55_02595 [Candidatus Magasanikbacteria bacterium]|nr:hypothetical protein [Candidatus Magasanikbacteria bacterium]
MPQNLAQEDVNIGPIIYQWTVKEYEQYTRDRRWYVIMGVLALAMIAYGVVAANYLFALIIILFGIILYLHHMQDPLEITFIMTETGIVLGKKYYHYSELKNFWLIYNPPDVKNLYFSLHNVIKHRLQIPLLDYDPRPIRTYLSQYLTEDLEQEEEPLSDRVGRLFQLH